MRTRQHNRHLLTNRCATSWPRISCLLAKKKNQVWGEGGRGEEGERTRDEKRE